MSSDSINLYKFLVKYDDDETQEIEFNLRFGSDVAIAYEEILENEGKEKAHEYLSDMVLDEESEYGAVSVEYLGNREITFQEFE